MIKQQLYNLFLMIAAMLISASLTGQVRKPWVDATVPIALGKAKVLPIEGLSLREKPSLKANRLALIPYDTQIKVIDNASGKLDSLPIKIAPTEGLGEAGPTFFRGWWVKVRYLNQVGYVFDPFLIREMQFFLSSRDDEVLFPETNREFRLMQPGSTCVYNLADLRKYQWWGLYRMGDECLVKPVRLQQHMSRTQATEDVVYQFLYSNASEPEGLMSVIGVAGAWGGTRSSELKYRSDWMRGYHDDSIRIKKVGIQQVPDHVNSNPTTHLYWWQYQVGLTAQRLRKESYGAIALDLAADLDGDGKQDLIVTYGEESTSTVLYLSTHARAGELLRPVAVFYSGYCC